jgi:hypothetical protein
MIDLEAAREHLRETLSDSIEIDDEAVLDAAALVVVNGKAGSA